MDKENKNQRERNRRLKPTPFFNSFLFWGRRTLERRKKLKKEGYYVDRFLTLDWCFFIILVFLNVLDLCFTLFYINKGYAEEANPIMKFALEYGGYLGFILLKLSLVLPSAFIIFLHSRFPRIKLSFVFLNTVYIFLLLLAPKSFFYN